MTSIEAVFLDRDGTIGGDCSVHYPGDLVLFPFTAEAIGLLKKAGIKLFAFTNQPGISEGQSNIYEFEQELAGLGFDKAYICPHGRDENCNCRKPKHGMLAAASEEYDLNLTKCVRSRPG